MSLLQRLIVYIMKKDLPSAIEDALHVAKAYDGRVSESFVYMSRIEELMNCDKVGTAVPVCCV